MLLLLLRYCYGGVDALKLFSCSPSYIVSYSDIQPFHYAILKLLFVQIWLVVYSILVIIIIYIIIVKLLSFPHVVELFNLNTEIRFGFRDRYKCIWFLENYLLFIFLLGSTLLIISRPNCFSPSIYSV